MKTRWIAGAVVVLLCVAALVIAVRSKKPQDVRIGAVLPLTGDLAIYGQKMKRGIDLAISQANAQGGVKGRHIQVHYEDDQGDPKTSIAATQKLITVDGVKVIIGGAISATALPCIPIIDRSHVVLFSPAATSPSLSGASKYFFRNWPPDTYDGTAMGEFAAKSLRLKQVAVLYVNNEWGVAISKIFTDTFQADGGRVTITESYEPNATDFRTQLTKIAARRPEAIYIPGYLKELITILRQKQELRITAKVLSAYGFYDPQILQQDGGVAEGAIFTAPAYDPDNQDPGVTSFVTAFHKAYGDKPDIWAAQAYDAARIVLSALQTGASTGPEIRDVIAKVKGFDGVTGRTSFDANGDVQKPLRFLTVRSGQFTNYTPEK
jgi:branched-chain amino acid transport system substrate-binding protein